MAPKKVAKKAAPAKKAGAKKAAPKKAVKKAKKWMWFALLFLNSSFDFYFSLFAY